MTQFHHLTSLGRAGCRRLSSSSSPQTLTKLSVFPQQITLSRNLPTLASLNQVPEESNLPHHAQVGTISVMGGQALTWIKTGYGKSVVCR